MFSRSGQSVAWLLPSLSRSRRRHGDFKQDELLSSGCSPAPGPSILSRMLGRWAACSGSSFWGRLIYGATAKVISLPQPHGLGLSRPLLKIAQDKESQGPVTSCTQDPISPCLLHLAAQPSGYWVPEPVSPSPAQSQL